VSDNHELFTCPPDLKMVPDAELSDLETRGVAEFDRVNSGESTPDAVDYALRLTADLDRIRAERAGREAKARVEADAAAAKAEREMAALATRVHGSESTTSTEAAAAAPAPVDVEAIAAAASKGATEALVSVLGDKLPRARLSVNERASLSATQQHAGSVQVPERRLAVTASVDIPGVQSGRGLTNLSDLADAFIRKAKSLTPTRTGAPEGPTVATIRNEFQHTVDNHTSPSQVGELINFLRSSERTESLVAGGGWCAPSEVRYDFFNVADSDGLIDLPTIGISRGGIRFPVSPSLGSAVWTVGGSANQNLAGFGGQAFNVSSMPWLWTEASDIATVTGSPNKPCVRVPCPTFSEERLECYGICLTAGNLTDDAYPEATQNTIRLLMTAHQRAINARLIALMVARSTSSGTLGLTVNAAFQNFVGGLNLAATDYRESLGMGIDAVVEVVAPHWMVEVIQGDLAWRTGTDQLLSVTKAQITGYLADRNIRVQWVDDWQVRGSGLPGAATAITEWPSTAQIMLYAAGTFVRGTGLTLDLGVIRDSVLNAENDYTAAWTEECNLIAQVGHSSRLYTVNIEVNGSTGATITPNATGTV
jgi:hypothetical protein